MSDNGSSLAEADARPRPDLPGWQFNAGLRGFKNDVYEGGHRVPFLISWPGGRLGQPRNVGDLTAHIDVVPTLLELAGLPPAAPGEIDGESLVPLLRGGKLSPRTLVVTNQRVDQPTIDRPEAVLTDRWRLVYPGDERQPELYDIIADPAQQRDLAVLRPDVVQQLAATLRRWWTDNAPSDPAARQRIIVGGRAEPVSRLSAMDWMEAASADDVPWFPGFARPGDINLGNAWLGKEANFTAHPWYLSAARAGRYRIEGWLHDKPAATPIRREFAILEINGARRSIPLAAGARAAQFAAALGPGAFKLKLWFADDPDGRVRPLPAFYAYVHGPRATP